MSYVITKEVQFDAAHRVPLHASKCKNLHGHRYRVVAHVEGELITEGPESGMVRDFSIVKQKMNEKIHDVYDHGTIVYEGDQNLRDLLFDSNDRPVHGWNVRLVPFIPTAECLAKFFFEELEESGLKMVQLDVWETPTSCASYRPDPDANWNAFVNDMKGVGRG